MIFTLFARPLPANARLPAASCTSTQESAENLKRRRARPVPALASDSVAVAAIGIAGPAPGGVTVGAGATADLGGADMLDGAADVPSVAAGSVAPPVDAALEFAATGGAGTDPRWCHGFHQNTTRTSSAAADHPTMGCHATLLTADESVRSLTFAGCEATVSGVRVRDS
jgi:hypothetical protein